MSHAQTTPIETLTNVWQLQDKPRVEREIKKMRHLKAILFDCDNTLVMTEGIAFRQTAGLVNELMTKYEIDESYTGEKLIGQYFGMTFKEMLPELAEKHGFELTPELAKQMAEREEEEVIKAINKEAVPCPGVTEALMRLKAEGHYKMAIVSSSSLGRIKAATETTDLARFFSYTTMYSAKTSLPKPVGKPAPDVYVHAMKKLGVKPSECLAFEDSRTGMQAAIAAKIACVGYVGCYSGKAKQVQLEGDFDDMGAVTTIYHWSEFRALVKKITAWAE